MKTMGTARGEDGHSLSTEPVPTVDRLGPLAGARRGLAYGCSSTTQYESGVANSEEIWVRFPRRGIKPTLYPSFFDRTVDWFVFLFPLRFLVSRCSTSCGRGNPVFHSIPVVGDPTEFREVATRALPPFGRS